MRLAEQNLPGLGLFCRKSLLGGLNRGNLAADQARLAAATGSASATVGKTVALPRCGIENSLFGINLKGGIRLTIGDAKSHN